MSHMTPGFAAWIQISQSEQPKRQKNNEKL